MTWHPPETETHKPVERIEVYKKPLSDKTGTKNKIIMHIDMDAFFASIEQRDTPSLKGKPVIVGAPKGQRGVVSTCSYEARAYGVKSGMPIAEAEKKCPHGHFVKGSSKKYVDASIKVMEIFKKYTPIVQPISIDEAYLDLTGCTKIYGGVQAIAQNIKNDIFEAVKLTCTIGVAHNKIMAKLASGYDKPDGLTVFGKEDIEPKVYPLPVQKLYGIGDKTNERLSKLGIRTIGDLAKYPEKYLTKTLGIVGKHLKKVARGDSGAEVIAAENRPYEKSVGHEHTFLQDVGDFDKIDQMLLKLCQKVGRRLRKNNFRGRTITLKLRYANFETLTHRKTFPNLVDGDTEIFEAGKMLLEHVFDKKRQVRLIGISLSGLVKSDGKVCVQGRQINLFEDFRKAEVNFVIDTVRNKHGEKSISRLGATR